ncbi:hypothetical protein D3C81_1820600 [compost metagenome]
MAGQAREQDVEIGAFTGVPEAVQGLEQDVPVSAKQNAAEDGFADRGGRGGGDFRPRRAHHLSEIVAPHLGIGRRRVIV